MTGSRVPTWLVSVFVVRTGERVIVNGTIRDMRGIDIPPCFASRGIDLENLIPD